MVELLCGLCALLSGLLNLKLFTGGSRLDNFWELFIVDATILWLIIKIKDPLDILFLSVGHDNSKFLDGSFELVQGNATQVCNIEEFECFSQKQVLLGCGGTFLIQFSHQVILKSAIKVIVTESVSYAERIVLKR